MSLGVATRPLAAAWCLVATRRVAGGQPSHLVLCLGFRW
jgi:hypothetical protein